MPCVLDRRMPLLRLCKPFCSSLYSNGSAESIELNQSHAVSPSVGAGEEGRGIWGCAQGQLWGPYSEQLCVLSMVLRLGQGTVQCWRALSSASPGQHSRKGKHLSGFSPGVHSLSFCSSTAKWFYF